LQAAHDGEIWLWRATHMFVRWSVASI
jgi:hypothetical protein